MLNISSVKQFSFFLIKLKRQVLEKWESLTEVNKQTNKKKETSNEMNWKRKEKKLIIEPWIYLYIYCRFHTCAVRIEEIENF